MGQGIVWEIEIIESSASHQLRKEVEKLRDEVNNLWAEVQKLKGEILEEVKGFESKETTMVAQQPGNTIGVTFTPVPANATLTTPPVITSSDPVNAPVTADATGLIATVAFPASAELVAFTLRCEYTNPDGTAALGTFTGQIVAPVLDATSFDAAQTT